MIRLLWELSAHARYYLRRYMPTNIALDRWPHLRAYLDRVAARPAVKAAMVAEGLIAA